MFLSDRTQYVVCIKCIVIFIPWYNIKVIMLRLQMVPEDLPTQFNAPSLACCSVGWTTHIGGSEGGLGHLHNMGVIVITEQLRARNTIRLGK